MSRSEVIIYVNLNDGTTMELRADIDSVPPVDAGWHRLDDLSKEDFIAALRRQSNILAMADSLQVCSILTQADAMDLDTSQVVDDIHDILDEVQAATAAQVHYEATGVRVREEDFDDLQPVSIH